MKPIESTLHSLELGKVDLDPKMEFDKYRSTFDGPRGTTRDAHGPVQ